jgi:uncharacterized protein (DUF4415 family)
MTESRRRIGSDLAKVDAHVIQPHEYEEAPEWTAEDFARAEIREGDKLIRRGRPPLGDRPKEAVKLRLSADVLDYFRSTGKGWQTRINETLERHVTRAKKRQSA